MEESPNYSIKTCEALGRYLIAKRDLEEDEIVIRDYPLVVAPSGKFDVNPVNNRHFPVCINCCKSETPGGIRFLKCPGCSWPLCSTECMDSLRKHSRQECSLFHRRGIAQTPRSLKKVYLIRCSLMKENNPKDWKKFSELAYLAEPVDEESLTSSPEDEESPSTQTRESSNNTNDFKYLREVCDLDYVSLEDVNIINGVMRVNGFGLTNPGNSGRDRYYGMAIYYLASMASHGCSPNLSSQLVYDDGPGENFFMVFKTKTRLKVGSVLQIAYREKWLQLGTLRRREKIYQDHRFWCQCSRCRDPTENGTDFSSIKCHDCIPGYLRPQDSLNGSSHWRCGNEKCGNVRGEEEISQLIDSITEETETVIESDERDEAKFERLGLLLEGRICNALHPNHYLVLRAQVEWMRVFPFQRVEEAFLANMDDPETAECGELMAQLVRRKKHCESVYDRLIYQWSDKDDVIYATTVKAIEFASKFSNESAILSKS